MASSGKVWREAREKGIEITFSGADAHTVAIRPIEIDLFVQTNDIPDVMATWIADIIKGDKPYKIEIPAQERIEQSKQWIKFLNDLIRFAFVNPKVVDDPQADDEISIEDVSYSEKLQLFQFFTRPAQLLRGFRDKQTKSVEAVVPTANGDVASEPRNEDKPVGQPGDRIARLVDSVAVR